MPGDVKICGLKTPEAVTAAVDGGATYVGFVFFPPSPRNVNAEEAAALAGLAPNRVKKVGLFVDADDRTIRSALDICPLDILQLHGKETPERVATARENFSLPVMKACSIAGPDDIRRARDFEPVADLLLFDARPSKEAALPGGNALAFDWKLLAGTSWSKPWLLAGGLDPDNVAEAIRISGAPGVDVSSGVESAKGVKDIGRINAFLDAVKAV